MGYLRLIKYPHDTFMEFTKDIIVYGVKVVNDCIRFNPALRKAKSRRNA